jgi:hypothetical protein
MHSDPLNASLEASKLYGEVKPPIVACLVALIDGFELAVAIDAADATPAAIAGKLKDAATALLTGERVAG